MISSSTVSSFSPGTSSSTTCGLRKLVVVFGTWCLTLTALLVFVSKWALPLVRRDLSNGQVTLAAGNMCSNPRAIHNRTIPTRCFREVDDILRRTWCYSWKLVYPSRGRDGIVEHLGSHGQHFSTVKGLGLPHVIIDIDGFADAAIDGALRNGAASWIFVGMKFLCLSRTCARGSTVCPRIATLATCQSFLRVRPYEAIPPLTMWTQTLFAKSVTPGTRYQSRNTPRRQIPC